MVATVLADSSSSNDLETSEKRNRVHLVPVQLKSYYPTSHYSKRRNTCIMHIFSSLNIDFLMFCLQSKRLHTCLLSILPVLLLLSFYLPRYFQLLPNNFLRISPFFLPSCPSALLFLSVSLSHYHFSPFLLPHRNVVWVPPLLLSIILVLQRPSRKQLFVPSRSRILLWILWFHGILPCCSYYL